MSSADQRYGKQSIQARFWANYFHAFSSFVSFDASQLACRPTLQMLATSMITFLKISP